jgi:DNA repair exonuclease SbcCD nuclease subunit
MYNDTLSKMDEFVIRVLCIGDPHLKKSAVAEYQHMISEILKVAIKASPDIIIVLGDTLHDKENIKTRALSDAIRFFKDLSKIATTVVLIGNHDREVERGFDFDIHPFVGIERSDSFDVLIANRIDTISVGNLKFVLIPYIQPGELHNELSKAGIDMNEIKPTACFAHQEIRGCIMKCFQKRMYQQVSQIGDIWPNDYPLLISGHIHKRHKPQTNVHYVGTPRQIDVDEDENKGVTIYDFYSSGEVKDKLIKLRIPPKRIVEIHVSELDSYSPPPDVKIELRIKGTYEEVKSFMNSLVVKKLRKLGVVVKASPEILSIEKSKMYTKFERLSHIDILRELLSDDEVGLQVLDHLLKAG